MCSFFVGHLLTCIQTEFTYKVKPKLPAQFSAAEKNGVPWGIILAEDELARGCVKIKEMGLPKGHPEKDGVEVKLNEVVAEMQKRVEGRYQSVVQEVEDVKLEEA